MDNPFTSVSGILLFIAAVLNLVAHALGGSLDQNQVGLSLVGIIAGAGLLNAKDGGV